MGAGPGKAGSTDTGYRGDRQGLEDRVLSRRQWLKMAFQQVVPLTTSGRVRASRWVSIWEGF